MDHETAYHPSNITADIPAIQPDADAMAEHTDEEHPLVQEPSPSRHQPYQTGSQYLSSSPTNASSSGPPALHQRVSTIRWADEETAPPIYTAEPSAARPPSAAESTVGPRPELRRANSIPPNRLPPPYRLLAPPPYSPPPLPKRGILRGIRAKLLACIKKMGGGKPLGRHRSV